MSEDENVEIVHEEPIEPVRRDRKPMIIITAIVGIVVLGILLLWMSRRGDEGQPVSAPRTVTFGDNTATEPTTEQTLTIQPDQVDRIGLKVETVGETLSSEATSVASAGVIQANAYKETPVIALVGGVVRRVNAELGQSVGRGQTLAVVYSSELADAQAKFVSLQTDAQTARQNYDRAARLVKISPVSSAEVEQALARLKTVQAELVENQKKHQRTVKLVEIGAASREELEQAVTKLRTSEADVEEAKKRYDRAVAVANINPISRSEFEQAAVRRQTAESDLAAARQRLILLGLAPGRVDALRSPSQISSELAVTAPVSGTVTARQVNVGETIEANKELLRVTDLSSVWAVAQVYEKDIGLVRTGSGATVTTAVFPGRVFRGHVTYIDPNLNAETRTAQARIELDNPGQVLKIGMYVNVAFGSTGMAERTMPVIPASAVQEIKQRQVVFVSTDKPNVFIVRPVRLGAENNGRFIVLEGLTVGDRIVTEGSFLLRAEILKQNP